MITLNTKSCLSVTLVFRYIFNDPKYSTRLPTWIRTDKGKEFLNKRIHDILGDEGGGIQIQVC